MTNNLKNLLNSGIAMPAIPASHNNKGGYNDVHHLIELKEPPASLVALREELMKPQHADIANYAKDGPSFSEVMARIAIKLDIVLDGEYDAAELCEVLANALRGRFSYKGRPHLSDSRLMNVEIVEREGEITLEKNEEIGQVVEKKKEGMNSDGN